MKGLVFFIIFCSQTALSASIKYWESQSPLEWIDFQGLAPNPAPADAFSSVYLVTPFYERDPLTGKLSMEIQAVFDRSVSWHNLNTDSDLLNHERGHFDLTELSARKLRERFSTDEFFKTLLSSCQFDQQKLDEKINDFYMEEALRHEEQQHLYDHDTGHGIPGEAQDSWIDSIQTGLGIYSSFSDGSFEVLPADGDDLQMIDQSGKLSYSLLVKSSLPMGGDYSWKIEGYWTIELKSNGKAHLSHARTSNNYSGSLVMVTDPPLSNLNNIPWEIDTDDQKCQRVDFSSIHQAPSAHLLRFRLGGPNPQDRTLNFPHVGQIALGQWMKNWGRPDLKAWAPRTGDSGINFSVVIDEDKFFKLRWELD